MFIMFMAQCPLDKGSLGQYYAPLQFALLIIPLQEASTWGAAATSLAPKLTQNKPKHIQNQLS